MKPAIALVLLLGCTADATRTFAAAGTEPDTPEAVVTSLVEKLVAIAPRFPELATFPKYATNRQDILRVDFEQGYKTEAKYVHEEFEPHGLLLGFSVSPDNLLNQPEGHATMRHLTALHLRVYAFVHYAPSPTPGLREELSRLISDHVRMLEALDRRAANQTEQGAGARPSLLPPSLGLSAQSSNETFKLRATVIDVAYLSEFKGDLMETLTTDPRFSLTLRVESILPPLNNYTNGSLVSFAIHSPALLGLSDSSKYLQYDFIVSREVQEGLKGPWHFDMPAAPVGQQTGQANGSGPTRSPTNSKPSATGSGR